MNINGRQVVAGIGGSGVHVGQYVTDGPVAMTMIQPPTAGNGPCWTAPGNVMLNSAAGELSVCLPDGSGLQALQPPRGATSYGMDDAGVQWAAYLADMGRTGVYTSWGLSLPSASWAGIGPALFLKPTQGTGLVAYPIGGTVPLWALPAAQPLDFFGIDAHTAIWTEGDHRLRTTGIRVPAQFESINAPTAFFALGQWWLMYVRGQGGACIRSWDQAARGFIVAPVGQVAFGACSIQGDREQDRICFWGRDAGETTISALTIDLTGSMVDLEAGPVVPTIPKLIKPTLVGVFFPTRTP